MSCQISSQNQRVIPKCSKAEARTDLQEYKYEGNSNSYKLYYIQMLGSGENEGKGLTSQVFMMNWTPGQTFCYPGLYPQPYLVPFPEITGSNFDRNTLCFYLLPLPSPPNLVGNLECGENLANDEQCGPRHREMENRRQKNQHRSGRVGQRERREKKIIELENIKENERNRNILSNCLKLALKSIRNGLKQQQEYSFFHRIAEAHQLRYPLSQFTEWLNELLPPETNYIRPSLLKQILEEQPGEFTIVLKIMLRKFFTTEIYACTGKNTAMRKLIKIQHIRAGRKLVQFLFECPQGSNTKEYQQVDQRSLQPRL